MLGTLIQVIFTLTLATLIFSKSINDFTSQLLNADSAGRIILKKEQLIIVENDGEYPYIATLFNNQEPICGAVIYKANVVLTSAHCVRQFIKKPSEVAVRAGTFYLNKEDDSEGNIQSIKAKKIIIHPSYNKSGKKDHDIAIIHLIKFFNLTKFVNTVKLPTAKDDRSFTGENLIAVGFGKTKDNDRSSILLKGEFILRSYRICSKVINFFDSSMICGYGNKEESFCHGDSGGPLIKHFPKNPKKDILVGVISFSFDSKKMTCDPDYPSVAANIAYLRSWIDQNL